MLECVCEDISGNKWASLLKPWLDAPHSIRERERDGGVALSVKLQSVADITALRWQRGAELWVQAKLRGFLHVHLHIISTL